MCKILSSPMSLEAARCRRDSMLAVQAPGCPLRFWPVVIAAESDDHYRVVEAGFATANGFDVVA